jgi:hypothetical protein
LTVLDVSYFFLTFLWEYVKRAQFFLELTALFCYGWLLHLLFYSVLHLVVDCNDHCLVKYDVLLPVIQVFMLFLRVGMLLVYE